MEDVLPPNRPGRRGSALSKSTRRIALLVVLALPSQALTQQSNAHPISLSAVVQDAEKNYPSIRISQEELNATAANLALVRTAYLPALDGMAQFNRGTRNNVFGSLLPQSVIPSISGPVLGTNNGGSVWGSAAGLLINWQPFDFGLRRANVHAAEAARDRAIAGIQRTRLEVQAASADAFLTVLASQSARLAAQAAIDNWETLRTTVHALVVNELRPGADEARIEAEKAAVVTQFALANQATATSEATLHKFLSVSGPSTLTPGKLLTDMPAMADADTPLIAAGNPAVMEQRAAVQQNAAQLQAIQRTWVPQFNLEGAAYARGTGAETNGLRLSGADGLAPNVVNYVAGVNITFPFLGFASAHARQAAEAANLQTAKSGEELVVKNLQEQFEQAKAALRANQQIAQNTPIQLRAAQTSLSQATARYKAGLVPIDDVAQAQRLLVQAQMDDSIARLNVWRAFLRVSYIRGDLLPFLQEVNR